MKAFVTVHGIFSPESTVRIAPTTVATQMMLPVDFSSVSEFFYHGVEPRIAGYAANGMDVNVALWFPFIPGISEDLVEGDLVIQIGPLYGNVLNVWRVKNSPPTATPGSLSSGVGAETERSDM